MSVIITQEVITYMVAVPAIIIELSLLNYTRCKSNLEHKPKVVGKIALATVPQISVHKNNTSTWTCKTLLPC